MSTDHTQTRTTDQLTVRPSIRVDLDEASEQFLLGVDRGQVSVAICAPVDIPDDRIERAVETARKEIRHSLSVLALANAAATASDPEPAEDSDEADAPTHKYDTGGLADRDEFDVDDKLRERDRQLRTDGGRDVVYVTGGQTKRTTHADPECPRLARANKVVEKPAAAIPDGFFDECGWCIGNEGPTATDGGEMLVKACPNCDFHDIRRRTGRTGQHKRGTWRCQECDTEFDEPIERPPRDGAKSNNCSSLSDAGRALLEADDFDDLIGRSA